MSDAAAFNTQFGLPQFNVTGGPTLTTLNEYGNTSPLPAASGTTGQSVETSLDVEWAHAVAPQANIVLLEASSAQYTSLSFSDLATAVGTARNLAGVSVISMSYGYSESWIYTTLGSGAEVAQDSLYTTPASHTGVTFVASSGDDGSTIYTTSPTVSYPAASPNVLAVGGTNLTLSGSTYAGEAAWSDSGGGQSQYESEPAYQNGLQHSGKRQVPDVAFDANSATGVPIYDSYDYGSGTGWIKIGGTSLSAPCWAGLIATVDQLRVSQGLGTLDGATQALPDLYSLRAADFHDVTSGYNSYYPGYGFSSNFGTVSNGYPNSGFAAAQGYDEVTGLGTPVANNLASDFINPVTTTTTLSISAGSTTYGQLVTVTATVAAAAPQTGTPTGGTVTFMDGTVTLGSATLTGGTAAVTVTSLPAGLDTLTASYSGSGSNFAPSSTNGQAATLVAVAGSGPLSAVGTSLSPFGAAIDSSGNLYFADPKHNVVREVTPAGVVTTVAGNGTAGYTGNGSQATAAELHSPAGVAVDSSNNLFIADTNNSVIREVIHSTGLISVVAGMAGYFGYNGDGGQATATYLDWPTGVAVDAGGNLFIADTRSALIRKVTHSNGLINTVAGDTPTSGYYGYTGDGGQATAAELYMPMGVVVDSSGNLYIADTKNNVIRKVTSSGIISTIAGTFMGWSGGNYTGDAGQATAATLSYPVNLALDSSNHLFIADYGNDRIRQVNLSTPNLGVITTVAGGGLIDNGPATAAALNGPAAMVADTGGHLYIADYANNCVRQLTLSTGLISTIAGIGISGANGDTGQGTAAALDWPTATAVDTAGHLFIADQYNQRVREVNLSTGAITTFAGNGTAGYTGDTNQATAAELNNPMGVAADTSGNLFIADSANNCIRKVNLASGVITTIAGNGTAGYNGDNIQATAAQLNDPTGVAVDAAGDIFIADCGNNRVREITSGVITTIAGTGTAGYNGDSILAATARLNAPSGIALNAAGNLLIADTANNRIRLVTFSTNYITTVAGNGTAAYSGDTGQATAACIINPLGVAADASGNLFIGDTANNAVREVAPTGVIVTLCGNATPGYRPNNVSATAAVFHGPAGLAVDSRGNLYIADTQNDLVRQLGAAMSVTVAKAGLTVTGITANNKAYDGTTTATLNSGSASLVGVISGDTVTPVTAGATGAFAGKDVGTGISVSVAGVTLGGAQASNYTLIQPATTANITRKALTVQGSTASAKVYDGTSAEALGGTAAFLAAETAGAGTTGDGKPYTVDSITIGGTATGTFASKNVGIGIAVTVSGVTVTGTNSGDYSVTQQTGLTANITARPVTVTAASNSKVYDGTTSAAAVPAITPMPVSGDTANFTETYDTKGVGTGKTLTPAGSVSDGNSGNNYAVSFVTNTSGVITQEVISVASTQVMPSLEVSSNVRLTVGSGGDLTVNSPIVFDSGGEVDVLSGGRITVPGISSQSGAIGINLNGGTLRAGATFTTTVPITIGAGGATIDPNGFSVGIAGAVTGVGGLTITDSSTPTHSGTVTLSNSIPNSTTYAGGTTVTSGRLLVSNANAIPAGTNYAGTNLTISGGAVVLSSNLGRAIVLNGLTIGGAGGTNSTGAAVSLPAKPLPQPTTKPLAAAIKPSAAATGPVSPTVSAPAVYPVLATQAANAGTIATPQTPTTKAGPPLSSVKAPPLSTVTKVTSLATSPLQSNRTKARDAALQAFSAKRTVDLAWVR